MLALAITGRAAIAQDLSLPGPYPVGTRSATLTRANATTFTASLYYPAAAAGANTALSPTGGPFAVVCFGHGFLQPVSRYASTLSHLASHGLVVIAPESGGSLFPSHAEFAQDLSLGLTYILQQAALPASFLYQRVDAAALGLFGHSMGGGCSLLAAAADSRVRAVATLAAAETNPSAISACAAIGAAVPVTLICGSADTIVPPANNGQPMYAAVRGPRQLPLLQGGFHCGFEDVTSFGCDSGSLPRSEQLSITRRLLTEWFTLYLRSDQSVWDRTWGPASRPPEADARITRTADPRMTLAPADAALSAPAGATVSTTILLGNTGSALLATDLFATGGSEWAAVLSPDPPPALGPGQTVVLTLQVTIPPPPAPASDTLVVSARAQTDGGTRAFARLALSRPCPADADGNGAVEPADIAAFVNTWSLSLSSGTIAGDFDGDGAVQPSDVAAFVGAWFAALGVGC